MDLWNIAEKGGPDREQQRQDQTSVFQREIKDDWRTEMIVKKENRN